MCLITGLHLLADFNLCNTMQVAAAYSWLQNQTKFLNLITSSENTILED